MYTYGQNVLPYTKFSSLRRPLMYVSFVKVVCIAGLLYCFALSWPGIGVVVSNQVFKVEKGEFGLNDPTARTQRLFAWIIPNLNRELHWHSELCSELHTPSGSEVEMCVCHLRVCVCVRAYRWYYQCHRLCCSHCYIYNTLPLSLWPHTEWLPCVCAFVCMFGSASVYVCLGGGSVDAVCGCP